MATPVKSVQFRDAESIVKNYHNMGIPAWGIKQGGALNFKYQGESLDDGASQLRAYIELLNENESAAIYTLCLYEDPDGKITEKTPADLSWNFRLRDQVSGFMPSEMYGGGYGAMIGEIKALRKEMEEIKKGAAPEDHKLGIMGEIMEMEAFQPILMAVGTRLADLVLPAAKVGELKRVSGIPIQDEVASPPSAYNWINDPAVTNALSRLQVRVTDLGAMLSKLADLAEQKPGLFAMYLKMFVRH